MLTPREAAATQYAASQGMPRAVKGFRADDYRDLRVRRTARLQSTLAALRAARGTPQIVANEWDDAQLAAAAERVERQLTIELEGVRADRDAETAEATSRLGD